MKLIHPAKPHGGDQYGTTLHNSDSHINFPRGKETAPNYGTRSKAKAPYGGTQFGTTQQDSKPAKMSYPNANVKLKEGTVEQRGSAISVDSEKVIASKQGPGMSIKSQNTRDSGSTCGLGGQPAVRFPKKGQNGNNTAKVF